LQRFLADPEGTPLALCSHKTLKQESQDGSEKKRDPHRQIESVIGIG
jgi:hypothetical protein